MAKIIAIANQKGGVGKTTSTMNIGCYLSKMGKKVLLIDLDPQSNLSSYLGYEGNTVTIGELMQKTVMGTTVDISASIIYSELNGVYYIPSDINLANAGFYLVQAIGRETVLRRIISLIQEEYDYIIIDCLPSLCVLMMNALAAADGILIPVQTQKFAVDGLKNLSGLIEQMKSLNPKLEIIGILPTMVEVRTKVSTEALKTLADMFPDKVFTTYISKSTAAPKSSDRCKYISENEKIGDQYKELSSELIFRCEKRS